MHRIALLLCFVLVSPTVARPEAADPQAVLKQALHFADLYNWSDAGPLFAQAERMFEAQGDERDALYARFGRIRSTMEELSLPQTSQQLATELQTNPLLNSDQRLRAFALSVKADIDGELDAEPMRRDWEEVYKLAKVLNDSKLENRAAGEIGFAAFLEGDLDEARHHVAGALLKAQATGDVGAQIRYLAAIGTAQVLAGNNDDALGYFDKALKIANAEARNRRAYVRMEPGPGERFEVDWGHFDALVYKNNPRKLYAFCLVECHSRKLYLEFTHSQSFETFVRCHIHAFDAMTGCAREIWFDNLATAVADTKGISSASIRGSLPLRVNTASFRELVTSRQLGRKVRLNARSVMYARVFGRFEALPIWQMSMRRPGSGSTRLPTNANIAKPAKLPTSDSNLSSYGLRPCSPRIIATPPMPLSTTTCAYTLMAIAIACRPAMSDENSP
jgi:tetratricopeptide (TPR) repeat protein